MDAIDRQILALLVEDGRRTYDDVARHVALSAPAVKRRVDKLRAQGALRGFTAVVDHAVLGDQTEALIELFFAPGTTLDAVAATLRRHPEVVEAWSVTGDADAIARVRTRGQRRPRAGDHRAPARRTRRTHALAGRAFTACRALVSPAPEPCHNYVKVRTIVGMRDFLSAIRDRVLVFDGGMGATLEQFDLSLEGDYRLPGRCHEALVLNRPDVIEGVHSSMLEAGAEALETDTFQASRLKLAEWGLEDHTHEINLKAAQIAREAPASIGSLPARSARPVSCPPATTRRSARSRSRELVEVFTEQANGLIRAAST